MKMFFTKSDHVQFSPLSYLDEINFKQELYICLEVEHEQASAEFNSELPPNCEDQDKLVNETHAVYSGLLADGEAEHFPSASIPSADETPFKCPAEPKLSKNTLREKALSKAGRSKVRVKSEFYHKGTRSNSKTGFRGVRFSTNGLRFRATVNYQKKPFNVGTFSSALEAARAYDRALVGITNGQKKMRMRLNFPETFEEIQKSLFSDPRYVSTGTNTWFGTPNTFPKESIGSSRLYNTEL